MSNLCSTAKDLENFCGIFFDLERPTKNKWRILETTFTDVVLAKFAQTHPGSVEVVVSDERVTGADFEVLFLWPSGLGKRFIVQAKRAKLIPPKNVSWNYAELRHSFGKPKVKQIDELIKYAHKNGCTPLYAFYHSNTACRSAGTTPFSICDANLVRNIERSGVKKLACSNYSHISMPFSTLFCTFLTNPTQYLTQLSNTPNPQNFDLGLIQISDEQGKEWLNSSASEIDGSDAFQSHGDMEFGPERKMLVKLH